MDQILSGISLLCAWIAIFHLGYQVKLLKKRLDTLERR